MPIRDPTSLETYPGLVIGDMGEKVGLNGIDNGFMMFDRDRVSKDALLDAGGGIDISGNYVTPFKDPTKRFGASLGNFVLLVTYNTETVNKFEGCLIFKDN